MKWLDSHAHITDEAFNDDFDEMIQRIKDNEIERVLIVCCDVNEVEKALSIQDPDIHFDVAVGIHPSDQKELTDEIYETFLKWAKDDRIIAIGEIGLDYHWDKDNKEAQQALFIRQIKLANELNKPIIVHSRDAIQDTYDILKKYPCLGVMHCYSDSKEMAAEFLKLGMYISLAGPVTFTSAKEPKEVAKMLPLDRLLIETDCPYLAPVPKRGKRNEPSFVRHTGEYIAELKEVDVETLKKHLNENYKKLFKI